ncbi:MAG: prepilin-type N-terminal cleavage/methylation domain-containing protein, partial [Candidatus Kerfeldbacteria bacterium]|nr:prepilin-type N-terminal cleavage/methylation domain-containing protein [Candidatus Kerfeldbacteria bacterium]
MKKGFTIIESMVAISIAVIIIFILGNYIIDSYKTINFVNELNENIEEAKKGINIMNNELRKAASGENGAYA